MSAQPTAVQDLALDLLFGALGVYPINRTPEDYEEIKSRIPNLKRAHHLVNRRLAELAGTPEFERTRICRFKAGDTIIREEPLPTSISIETIRLALNANGWRAHREGRRRR
jgi:hypothetical protein